MQDFTQAPPALFLPTAFDFLTADLRLQLRAAYWFEKPEDMARVITDLERLVQWAQTSQCFTVEK